MAFGFFLAFLEESQQENGCARVKNSRSSLSEVERARL
jgi:hypothetical protein